jgi:two-component sensor histidine kinase
MSAWVGRSARWCRARRHRPSRDRELVTKDATIREIHHRVKNNP